MKKQLTYQEFNDIIAPLIEFNKKSVILEKDLNISFHESYQDKLFIAIDTLFMCVFEDYQIDIINDFIYGLSGEYDNKQIEIGISNLYILFYV